MPTRLVMGSCCRRKTVILQVYVEKPRGAIKRLSPSHHLHQHTKLQQGHHHIIKCKHGISIKARHNRKADLLHYARQSFHEPTQSAPLLATKEAVSSTNHQKPASKGLSVKKKKSSNSTKTPTNCLGNNKVLALKFLTSMMKFGTKMREKTNGGGESFGKKMKAIVNKFEVQRRCTFLKKLVVAFKKPRS